MEFSTIVVLMIVSGVVGVYVANRCRPHESGLEGFLHGACFGPVGWILLALYPIRPNPGDEPRERVSADRGPIRD
jgi:hypothetical protein